MATKNTTPKAEKQTTKRGPKPRDPNEVRELCPHCGRPMPRRKTYTAEQIQAMEARAAKAEERAVAARNRLAAINGQGQTAAPAQGQAPVQAPVQGFTGFRRPV